MNPVPGARDPSAGAPSASAQPVSAPSRSELRGFGLLVGGTFAAIGLWWLFRGKPGLPGALALPFAAGGLLLALLGAAAPAALVLPWRGWMALARAMSFVTTRVILFLVFALVVTPIGLVRRLTGADPLRRRAPLRRSAWHPYPARHLDTKHYEKGY